MQVLTISILGIIVIIGTTVFEKYLRRPTVLRKQNLFQRSLIGTMTLVFAVAMMFGTTILAEDSSATLTDKGGTLSFHGGAVQLIAPDGAVSSDTTVNFTVETSESVSAAPDGKALGSTAFTLSSSSAVSLKQLVKIQVSTANDANATISMYDSVSESWLGLSSAIPDVINNTLTASITNLPVTLALVVDAASVPEPTPEPAPEPPGDLQKLPDGAKRHQKPLLMTNFMPQTTN